MFSRKKDLMKKLDKHLVLAIDWVAAEYKYLEELKEELVEIKKEKKTKKEIKKIKKAISLLRYIGKAERRAFRFEKDINKELHELEEDFFHHVGEELHLKEIVYGLREVLKEFEVEEAHLVEFTSLYQGKLKEELTKAQVEAVDQTEISCRREEF